MLVLFWIPESYRRTQTSPSLPCLHLQRVIVSRREAEYSSETGGATCTLQSHPVPLDISHSPLQRPVYHVTSTGICCPQLCCLNHSTLHTIYFILLYTGGAPQYKYHQDESILSILATSGVCMVVWSSLVSVVFCIDQLNMSPPRTYSERHHVAWYLKRKYSNR